MIHFSRFVVVFIFILLLCPPGALGRIYTKFEQLQAIPGKCPDNWPRIQGFVIVANPTDETELRVGLMGRAGSKADGCYNPLNAARPSLNIFLFNTLTGSFNFWRHETPSTAVNPSINRNIWRVMVYPLLVAESASVSTLPALSPRRQGWVFIATGRGMMGRIDTRTFKFDKVPNTPYAGLPKASHLTGVAFYAFRESGDGIDVANKSYCVFRSSAANAPNAGNYTLVKFDAAEFPKAVATLVLFKDTNPFRDDSQISTNSLAASVGPIGGYIAYFQFSKIDMRGKMAVIGRLLPPSETSPPKLGRFLLYENQNNNKVYLVATFENGEIRKYLMERANFSSVVPSPDVVVNATLVASRALSSVPGVGTPSLRGAVYLPESNAIAVVTYNGNPGKVLTVDADNLGLLSTVAAPSGFQQLDVTWSLTSELTGQRVFTSLAIGQGIAYFGAPTMSLTATVPTATDSASPAVTRSASRNSHSLSRSASISPALTATAATETPSPGVTLSAEPTASVSRDSPTRTRSDFSPSSSPSANTSLSSSLSGTGLLSGGLQTHTLSESLSESNSSRPPCDPRMMLKVRQAGFKFPAVRFLVALRSLEVELELALRDFDNNADDLPRPPSARFSGILVNYFFSFQSEGTSKPLEILSVERSSAVEHIALLRLKLDGVSDLRDLRLFDFRVSALALGCQLAADARNVTAADKLGAAWLTTRRELVYPRRYRFIKSKAIVDGVRQGGWYTSYLAALTGVGQGATPGAGAGAVGLLMRQQQQYALLRVLDCSGTEEDAPLPVMDAPAARFGLGDDNAKFARAAVLTNPLLFLAVLLTHAIVVVIIACRRSSKNQKKRARNNINNNNNNNNNNNSNDNNNNENNNENNNQHEQRGDGAKKSDQGFFSLRAQQIAKYPGNSSLAVLILLPGFCLAAVTMVRQLDEVGGSDIALLVGGSVVLVLFGSGFTMFPLFRPNTLLSSTRLVRLPDVNGEARHARSVDSTGRQLSKWVVTVFVPGSEWEVIRAEEKKLPKFCLDRYGTSFTCFQHGSAAYSLLIETLLACASAFLLALKALPGTATCTAAAVLQSLFVGLIFYFNVGVQTYLAKWDWSMGAVTALLSVLSAVCMLLSDYFSTTGEVGVAWVDRAEMFDLLLSGVSMLKAVFDVAFLIIYDLVFMSRLCAPLRRRFTAAKRSRKRRHRSAFLLAQEAEEQRAEEDLEMRRQMRPSAFAAQYQRHQREQPLLGGGAWMMHSSNAFGGVDGGNQLVRSPFDV